MSTYTNKPRLVIDKSIAKLVAGFLQPVVETRVYTNSLDSCHAIMSKLVGMGCRGTAVATNTGPWYNELAKHHGDNWLHTSFTDTPEYYAVQNTFHSSFGCWPFQLNNTDDVRTQVVPIPVQDKMLHWKCSEGKPNREAPAHLIGLEGIMRATILGGYFAAIMPNRWVGRDMTYMRWWQAHAAEVARITLPDNAVRNIDPMTGEEKLSPGKWELLVFQRAMLFDDTTSKATDNNAQRIMASAEFRYPLFIYNMPRESSPADYDTCIESFKKSEWFKAGVSLFNRAVRENVTNNWCGTFMRQPYELPSLKDMFFFEPSEDKKYGIIIKDMAKAKLKRKKDPFGDPLAIQIKVTSRIKLQAYSAIAAAMVLEVKSEEGFVKRRDKTWEYNIDSLLKRKSLSEIKDQLVQKLEDAGLHVYMTPSDHQRFLKSNRRLAIQLTPVERTIPVKTANSSDALSSDETQWEKLYEDTGLMATFPEVVEQWRKRAAKIRLGEILGGFQLEDATRTACKDGIVDGNVMGLGKTRIEGARGILRGVDHILVVCPPGLVDTWKDEINGTFGPWSVGVRRNWNGKPMHVGINVIESASDTLPHNLKLFNIISFDRLKAVPRDVQFFRCPKCNMIACRKSRVEQGPMACPGNPADPEHMRCNNVIKLWKKHNEDHGLRKYKVVVDKDGNIRKRSDGKPMRVHWHTEDIKEPSDSSVTFSPVKSTDRIEIVDDRPPRPEVPKMELLENMCIKMKPKIVGYKKEINDNGSVVKTPIVEMVKRDFHVKWTFANLLRWRFSTIVVDEATHAKNEDSNRTQALQHINARIRVACTGTLIKGFPQNVLPILNWTLKRQVYPDYRPYDEDGTRRFMDKFSTEVTVIRGDGVVSPDGKVVGGTKKQLPKINNPELFQAELAPLMTRRIRNEPDVVKLFPRKTIVPIEERIPMDDEHRAYYQKWLDYFAEWWQDMKREVEGKDVPEGSLLVKLNYLVNASTIPHTMLDNVLAGQDEHAKEFARKIGRYTGKKATAKMRRSWRIALDAMSKGDKTIIGSSRNSNNDLGEKWAAAMKIPCVKVDGRVPMTVKKGFSRGQRHEMVSAFRTQNIPIMFAGIKALAEGLNIPEANHVAALDSDWAPNDTRQFYARVIRPAQNKIVYTYQLMHHGTIDEYQAAWCYLKARSSDEGLDYMEFDDFSGKIIPDIRQYAESIVDGTEETLKATMWLAIDHMRSMSNEEGEDQSFEGGSDE